MSDIEVRELFNVIDADGSGAIDAAELQELLTTDLQTSDMTFEPFCSCECFCNALCCEKSHQLNWKLWLAAFFELVSLWVTPIKFEMPEDSYVRFLNEIFSEITVPVNGGLISSGSGGGAAAVAGAMMEPTQPTKWLEP